MTEAHMIVPVGALYGVVPVDLDDAGHEDNYAPEDVEGVYTTVTEAALGYQFTSNGFKVHPSIAGHV